MPGEWGMVPRRTARQSQDGGSQAMGTASSPLCSSVSGETFDAGLGDKHWFDNIQGSSAGHTAPVNSIDYQLHMMFTRTDKRQVIR